jgi:phage-related minor tail protein
MAEAEIGNLGVKISLDHAALSRQLKIVQNEFKEAGHKLGDFGKTTEGLKLRSDSLAKQLDIQRQRVLALENAVKKSTEVKGADAKATQLLEVNLSKAKAQMAATEAELKKVTAELDKQTSVWHKVSTACESAGKKMQVVGEKISNVGKDLSLKITAPIVAAGAAAFKYGADIEDAIGATGQIFKDQSQAMQQWADNLESYYGIAESEALEYANTMGAMLQNIGGLTEEEAAKQAQTLIKLAGDLTAMFGGTTKDAVRALTGALKGNNTMLDNYGMGVNDATIKTKALEMGLIGEGEQLTLAAKQAATLALIMEQTADAQGQAAREAEGASGTMRALTTELKNITTEIGQNLLPVVTPALAKLRDLIKDLAQRFKEMSPETQKNIITIAGLAAAIGPLLVVIGKIITSFGTVTMLLGKLPIAIKAVGAAMAWLAANPIGLVITAIGALIAAGVLVYKNWDTVKYYGLQAWGYLKVGVLKAIDAIAGAYEKLLGWVPILGDKIRDAHAKVRAAIEAEQDILSARVKPGTAKSGADVAKGFREIEQESQAAAKGVRGAAGDISGALDDIVPDFDELGNAASGASSKTKEAAEKIKTAWIGTTEAIKSALSLLRTRHETEMNYAEVEGDKVEILRLKHKQLSEELEAQKAVVAATRKELEEATAAGVQEGETTEDLAKRIDELNKKLADEEKAQAQLEKQVYDTNDAIKAQGKSAKDLAQELKDVADAYYTDLAKALEDYQANVKQTNDALKRDTEALQRDLAAKLDDIAARGAERERQVTEQFQRELENRTRALMNFVGLFDEVTSREVSGEALLRNLEGQVSAFEDWQENIQKLAERGIDKGLLEELREMGPKAAPEIAALNALTDEQLTQYAALWKQKQEQARKEATAQLEQQRDEMNRQLAEIRADTANQLEQQRQEIAQKLAEMQAKAKEELEKYRIEWEKKNEEIRKNTEENVKDIHGRFNDLVGKSTDYGVSLIENFMDGIDSQMPALISKLESIAAMIDSYMPHSPAKRGPLKRIGEWGPAIIQELTEGIKRNLPNLENLTSRMALLSPGALQPAVANSYSTSNVNYSYGGNTIHITVQDGEDLLRTLHRLGVRLP